VSRTRFANAPGDREDRDVNGVRRVYGQAVAPTLGWRVHAGADRAATLTAAHRLVRRQGLILAAGLLAGLIATWLVYRRITRPIGLLSTAVRSGTPAAIAGPREVMALSAEFNGLVAEVTRELDERRRAERAAHELELNYRQLFGSNPHPMYVFDAETLVFLEVNDATSSYYGHPRTTLLEMSITDLALPEDTAALVGTVAGAATVEQWGPMRQVKADGSVVTVMITSHLLSFQGRRARCAVVEDITEKEQLERRLRQSQRLESLGQLAGGVAHDFNNLLSIIIGYATMCAQDVEVLAHAEPAMQRLHADLGQILAAGDRATNLTKQLLAFARHDAAQTKVLDLNTLVIGVEELLRRSIGEDVVMRVELTDEPWPIRADPGQVEQVLLNLAVNARDAMPTGGTLTIDTAPITVDEHYAAHHPGINVGRHMRLRVSDTGTGMSPETIERAFEPFFTTKPKGQGTGLGLATIYGILTRAGGTVQIYSEPGVGTTFTALFPATGEPTDAVDAAPDIDAARYQARDDETILVAEDEDSLRLLTERILARHGYTVLSAGDGEEALALAEQYPGRIDLLLTDVIMPRLGGHDVALRIQDSRPDLPVIYMSGYAEPLLATRSTLPEGVALLSKPATEHQILAALRRALDAAGSRRTVRPARS
jgi:PAS domain S-box-containing protein